MYATYPSWSRKKWGKLLFLHSISILLGFWIRLRLAGVDIGEVLGKILSLLVTADMLDSLFILA